MADENFFGMPADAPPQDFAAPPTEEEDAGGFTLLGDTPDGGAPYLGDVDETAGFAAPPSNDFASDFASPPDDGGYDGSAFAAPPTDGGYEEPPEVDSDTPIVLGGEMPPPDAIEPPQPEEVEEPEPTGPSPMQKFNEEWTETLKVRKDEENAKKAELVEASREWMENFHKEREQKRETRMAKNREDEQAKLEAIEADLENDNSWQRVCKMVELSHDGENAQDVKRMRDVMILLKNEPTRAAEVGA